MVLLARQQRPHRLVDPASVDRGHRPADALASESCPFEHALGFAVANLDVRNDAADSEIERVLCERTCRLGRDAASTGVWIEPIPDLDDRPLRVEGLPDELGQAPVGAGLAPDTEAVFPAGRAARNDR